MNLASSFYIYKIESRCYKNLSKKIIYLLLILFTLTPSYSFRFVNAFPEIYASVDSNLVIDNDTFTLGIQFDWESTIWRNRPILQEMTRNANIKLIRIWSSEPEPCKQWNEANKSGTWNWTQLDPLFQKIFEIGAEPLICLGFYDWNVNKIRTPPGMATDSETGLPYPASWAAYCTEWVKHFQIAGFPVKYYEMINEPHHYFGWVATQPKLGYYMNLYNTAARAMRAKNPNIKLGSDCLILKNVLDYFISNGENLDFLSYHGYGSDGNLDATDAEIFYYAENRHISQDPTKYGVDKARELYKASRGIDLPVIKSENNVNWAFVNGTDPRIQTMVGVVYHALTFRTSILKKYSCNIYYNFASSASEAHQKPTGGMGFGMVNSDNNKPWYPYYVYKMVGESLFIGDKILKTNSSSDDLRIVAWIHEDKVNILLICKINEPRTIYINGLEGQLEYQKLDSTISWENPAIQTGKIGSSDQINLNGYTVMLLKGHIPIFPFEDGFESGNLTKWTGNSKTSKETVEATTLRPYIGNFHGKFVSNGDEDRENAYCFKSLSDGESEIYARGYFAIDQGLPMSDNDDRLYFIRLTCDDESLAGIGIKRDKGVDKFVLYTRNKTLWPEKTIAFNYEMKTYHCFELHWKMNSQQGLAEMFVDGKKILEIKSLDTSYFGKVNIAQFGIIYTKSIQNGITVYGDNFKLSKTYVGQVYLDNWNFRKRISLNHNSVSDRLSDFPILVDITDPDIAVKARDDSWDILFTSEDGTKLSHEIESFDSTTGHLVAWVKVPNVSSTQDTIIYIYYGNSDAQNQQNTAGVWDNSYSLVQHLSDEGKTLYDSTSHKNDGNAIGGVTHTKGVIDNAIELDGRTGYIEVMSNPSISGSTDALTISCWVKLDDISKRQVFLNKYQTLNNQRGWLLGYNNIENNLKFFASPDGINFEYWLASYNIKSNKWYYITLVWESYSIPKFYINGSLVGTRRSFTISKIFDNPGTPLYIGKSAYVSGRELNGVIDEVRISKTKKSISWILTEFNDQQNPRNFITLSQEEKF